MRFRVLGPLEVTGADGPIALGGPKQRTVLAHLLLAANRVVSTEQLIDAVWGDEPPGSARNTLQSYVSSLRGVLGDDRLVHRPPGYSLVVAPEEVDALRFETLLRDARKAAPVDPRTSLGLLEDALALWRGEALADVADRLSLAGEATRLDELRLAAQEDRIEALLAAGEHARAASDLERLLSEHPLRERLWASLMLALYRDGRQSEALQAFQRAREILADELGIDPSPELA
ncbi:MAG TPA: AfsR/SARP family transcriptional regulator, partial [Actinomycetota bacterium]